MDLGLSGRAAVVTAASKGLGRGTALALAADGCDLVLNARGVEALAATAADCRALGVRVVEVAGDVAGEGAADALVQRALDEYGRLDVVVANAGGPPPGRALDVDDAALRAALEQNFLASVRLIRAGLAPMRAAGWGRVVCITSFSVIEPVPVLALSNTSRVALYAWCKTAAGDLAADPATAGITINLACPGHHATDRMLALGGSGRMGDPDDFGKIVAFLCSEAAAFVTGQAVVVDGGAIRGL